MKPTQDHRASQLDGYQIIRMIWDAKWTLLVVAIFSAGTAWGICKLLPPLYESHLVMVPGSSVSRDKQIQEFRYGYDADSERLMQFLDSEVILDSLEEEFSLALSWGIDKSEDSWHDKLVRMAKDRITFHKTRHSSVVVSVQDEEPQRASDLANETFRLLNTVNAGIVKENAKQVLASLDAEYKETMQNHGNLNDSISSVQLLNANQAIARLETTKKTAEQQARFLRDSLQSIRSRYQIYDYGYQVNVLNEQLAEARSVALQESGALEILKVNPGADSARVRTQARLSGAEKRVDYFESQLRDLSKVNSKYMGLLDKLEETKQTITNLEVELQQIRQSIEPKINSRQLSQLEYSLQFDRIRMEELRAKYQLAMSNYLNPLPLAHLVSPARPSYIAIYPKPMLSMVFAVVGCSLLTVVVLSMRAYGRQKDDSDAAK